MGHDHNHHSGIKNIRLAFFLNLGFTILEIIGGIWTNSIAIVSDALHDLGDSFSLGLSWYLQNLTKKEPSATFTFGFQRFSLLGALINSLVLIAGSVYVVTEAVERLQEPEAANAAGMIVFAIVGITVNGYAALKLSKGKTLNEKVLNLHLLEDVLGWVAVLIVAIVIQFWEVMILDAILSIAITAFVLFNVIKRLNETMKIFLQSSPPDINIHEMKEKLKAIKGVRSVHHVHSWSLDGEHNVLTAHLRLEDEVDLGAIKDVKQKAAALVRAYKFEHATIETELSEDECVLYNFTDDEYDSKKEG